MNFAVFESLFEFLEQFPGLQRRDWEFNQSGADRGMEAVLIQRNSRELASYALVRLRFAAMPDLLAQATQAHPDSAQLQTLADWGRTQGRGGSSLANVIEDELENHPVSERLLAACASLTYYRCRDDHNPAVKRPWSHGALDRIKSIEVEPLLGYPCRGSFWRKKFETVKDLTSVVLTNDWSDVGDEELLRELKHVDGVGPQTSNMVALFWLVRPVPVLDAYLAQLIELHKLVDSTTVANADRLREQLLQAAFNTQARCPDWPATRWFSCLYLWVCEYQREHCTCKGQNPSMCPLLAVSERWSSRKAKS